MKVNILNNALWDIALLQEFVLLMTDKDSLDCNPECSKGLGINNGENTIHVRKNTCFPKYPNSGAPKHASIMHDLCMNPYVDASPESSPQLGNMVTRSQNFMPDCARFVSSPSIIYIYIPVRMLKIVVLLNSTL